MSQRLSTNVLTNWKFSGVTVVTAAVVVLFSCNESVSGNEDTVRTNHIHQIDTLPFNSRPSVELVDILADRSSENGVVGNVEHSIDESTDHDVTYDETDETEPESDGEELALDEDDNDDTVSNFDVETIFDSKPTNVSTLVGGTAMLPCSVQNIGKYKVAWLDETSIALTYDERRIVDDYRFGVFRPEVGRWDLQIRDVKPDDAGRYRCTINTNPIRSKLVHLSVYVPPRILDEPSSDDVIVSEGSNVTLICNATGEPTPIVTWHRENTGSLSDQSSECRMQPDNPPVGLAITLLNVSRHCSDTYQCIADNGVASPVSRRMRVSVEFGPEIVLPNKRIWQSRDRETILECLITANPHALNYWEKNGKRISTSLKYTVEAYESSNAAVETDDDKTLTLSLRVFIADSNDYGDYRCHAENRLGRKNATMTLSEPLHDIISSITSSWSLSRSRDVVTERADQATTVSRLATRVGKSPDYFFYQTKLNYRDIPASEYASGTGDLRLMTTSGSESWSNSNRAILMMTMTCAFPTSIVVHVILILAVTLLLQSCQ